MPVCEECGEEFDLSPADFEGEVDFSFADIERFYRSIADHRSHAELLDEFYRMFSSYAGLAPPYTISSIAKTCGTVRTHD